MIWCFHDAEFGRERVIVFSLSQILHVHEPDSAAGGVEYCSSENEPRCLYWNIDGTSKLKSSDESWLYGDCLKPDGMAYSLHELTARGRALGTFANPIAGRRR